MVSCLKLIAAAMATGLLLTTAGCASTDDTNTPDGGTVTQSTGAVAIFTPSDGITLSQHTPLNKWAKLVPDITSELKKQGFKSANITTTTSSGLAKQSQDIQDYVVNHAVSAQSGKDSANKKDGADEKEITLIVAPAAETQTSTRQYGDYVSQTSGTATDRTGSDRPVQRMHRNRLTHPNRRMHPARITHPTRRTRNRCPVWRTHCSWPRTRACTWCSWPIR